MIRRATAFPNPDAPPVITAVRPENLPEYVFMDDYLI
jgi:hypothetical protein